MGGGLAAPPTETSTGPRQAVPVPRPPSAADNNDTPEWMGTGVITGGVSVVASSIVHSLSHWKIIMFGQFLALLMGLRGSSTALLYLKCNVMAPTFQMACVYLLLSFHLMGLARSQCLDRKTSALAKHHVQDFNVNIEDDDRYTERDLRHTTVTQRRTTTTERAAEPSMTPPSAPVVDMSILFQKDQMEEAAKRQYQYRIPGCKNLVLQTPWYRYLGLALLDVEGNVLVCMALKYTSIQSVTLLDTLAIPAAMLSSYIFLSKRYSAWHLAGASVCLIGASIMVLSDYEKAAASSADLDMGLINDTPDNPGLPEAGEEMEYPHAVFGDILASLGGICFGIKDTLSEETLQTSTRTEFLGMIGLYGLMLTAIQIALFERELVWQLFNASLCSPDATIGMFIAVVLIFAAYYIGSAQFLNISEAALLNLNLLTSDLYAIMFSIIEEHTLPNRLCGLSMALILSGVLIYESVPPPAEDYHGQHIPSPFGTKAYQEQPQRTNSVASRDDSPANNGLELEMPTHRSAHSRSANGSGAASSSFQLT